MANLETQAINTPQKTPQKTDTKDLLRFITCGSVDDGKSTLIGRLLYETDAIFDNEIETLKKDSLKFGTQNNQIDYALLVDGLSSEREQGITIDVAYRFFSSSKRKFIVADTPGHEQYTRNMATGASTASCAVIMIDARKGVLTQTKRHSFITSLVGVKSVIIAINKMDLMEYSESIFKSIKEDYLAFSKHLGFENIQFIPVSALCGDNVTSHSTQMPWYKGPNLVEALESLEVSKTDINLPFRLSVQWVNRPHLNFRGYTGTINQGSIKKGDKVTILPQGTHSKIKDIITFENSLNQAIAGEPVTLTLEDEVDVSRGDMICHQDMPCAIADNFQVTLLWMSQKPLIPGRQYLLKSATKTISCTTTKIKHQIDINTMQKMPAETLNLNEIGLCELNTSKKIPFEPYDKNPSLGSFILIDRTTNETCACGWLNFALRRSSNIHHHNLTITQKDRTAIKSHEPCVIWFTGISGAGKSTIANLLEQKLNQNHIHSVLLDGDNVRFGLNKDLGFTESDRAENIRRIAEVSKLMVEAGLITLVSFISPFEAERSMAKELIGKSHFIEVFVDTTLEAAEKRDVKGLYQKARKGEIPNFTGIDSPYQAPTQPDIHIKTSHEEASDAAEAIFEALKKKNII